MTHIADLKIPELKNALKSKLIPLKEFRFTNKCFVCIEELINEYGILDWNVENLNIKKIISDECEYTFPIDGMCFHK